MRIKKAMNVFETLRLTRRKSGLTQAQLQRKRRQALGLTPFLRPTTAYLRFVYISVYSHTSADLPSELAFLPKPALEGLVPPSRG